MFADRGQALLQRSQFVTRKQGLPARQKMDSWPPAGNRSALLVRQGAAPRHWHAVCQPIRGGVDSARPARSAFWRPWLAPCCRDENSPRRLRQCARRLPTHYVVSWQSDCRCIHRQGQVPRTVQPAVVARHSHLSVIRSAARTLRSARRAGVSLKPGSGHKPWPMCQHRQNALWHPRDPEVALWSVPSRDFETCLYIRSLRPQPWVICSACMASNTRTRRRRTISRS